MLHTRATAKVRDLSETKLQFNGPFLTSRLHRPASFCLIHPLKITEKCVYFILLESSTSDADDLFASCSSLKVTKVKSDVSRSDRNGLGTDLMMDDRLPDKVFRQQPPGFND